MPNCIYHCEAPSLVDGRAFSFCVSYIKWPKGHLTLYVWVLFIYVFIYLCWCSVQVFVVGSRSRKEEPSGVAQQQGRFGRGEGARERKGSFGGARKGAAGGKGRLEVKSLFW